MCIARDTAAGILWGLVGCVGDQEEASVCSRGTQHLVVCFSNNKKKREIEGQTFENDHHIEYAAANICLLSGDHMSEASLIGVVGVGKREREGRRREKKPAESRARLFLSFHALGGAGTALAFRGSRASNCRRLPHWQLPRATTSFSAVRPCQLAAFSPPSSLLYTYFTQD